MEYLTYSQKDRAELIYVMEELWEVILSQGDYEKLYFNHYIV